MQAHVSRFARLYLAWFSLHDYGDVDIHTLIASSEQHTTSSSPDLVDTQFAQRQVAVGYVAAMRDQG